MYFMHPGAVQAGPNTIQPPNIAAQAVSSCDWDTEVVGRVTVCSLHPPPRVPPSLSPRLQIFCVALATRDSWADRNECRLPPPPHPMLQSRTQWYALRYVRQPFVLRTVSPTTVNFVKFWKSKTFSDPPRIHFKQFDILPDTEAGYRDSRSPDRKFKRRG
jgi:hypothetical protein